MPGGLSGEVLDEKVAGELTKSTSTAPRALARPFSNVPGETGQFRPERPARPRAPALAVALAECGVRAEEETVLNDLLTDLGTRSAEARPPAAAGAEFCVYRLTLPRHARPRAPPRPVPGMPTFDDPER